MEKNKAGCGQQDAERSEQNDLQGYNGVSREALLRWQRSLGFVPKRL